MSWIESLINRPWFEEGDIESLILFFIVVGLAVLFIRGLYWVFPDIWDD